MLGDRIPEDSLSRRRFFAAAWAARPNKHLTAQVGLCAL
jgi:hypothetical protein